MYRHMHMHMLNVNVNAIGFAGATGRAVVVGNGSLSTA